MKRTAEGIPGETGDDFDESTAKSTDQRLDEETDVEADKEADKEGTRCFPQHLCT